MHEVGIVKALMRRAETEAGRDGARVVSLTLRIGALSGVAAEALTEHAHRAAMEMWGYAPRMEVELSEDVADPAALGVVLVSVRLEA